MDVNEMFRLLMEQFWINVFPLLVVAAGSLIIKETVPILRGVTTRLNYQIDQASEDRATAGVTKWVLAAESIFEAKVQAGLLPKASAGEDKLRFAIAGIAKDLPLLSEEEARVHVEASLIKNGLGAAKKNNATTATAVTNVAVALPEGTK